MPGTLRAVLSLSWGVVPRARPRATDDLHVHAIIGRVCAPVLTPPPPPRELTLCPAVGYHFGTIFALRVRACARPYKHNSTHSGDRQPDFRRGVSVLTRSPGSAARGMMNMPPEAYKLGPGDFHLVQRHFAQHLAYRPTLGGANPLQSRFGLHRHA